MSWSLPDHLPNHHYQQQQVLTTPLQRISRPPPAAGAAAGGGGSGSAPASAWNTSCSSSSSIADFLCSYGAAAAGAVPLLLPDHVELPLHAASLVTPSRQPQQQQQQQVVLPALAFGQAASIRTTTTSSSSSSHLLVLLLQHLSHYSPTPSYLLPCIRSLKLTLSTADTPAISHLLSNLSHLSDLRVTVMATSAKPCDLEQLLGAIAASATELRSVSIIPGLGPVKMSDGVLKPFTAAGGFRGRLRRLRLVANFVEGTRAERRSRAAAGAAAAASVNGAVTGAGKAATVAINGTVTEPGKAEVAAVAGSDGWLMLHELDGLEYLAVHQLGGELLHLHAACLPPQLKALELKRVMLRGEERGGGAINGAGAGLGQLEAPSAVPAPAAAIIARAVPPAAAAVGAMEGMLSPGGKAGTPSAAAAAGSRGPAGLKMVIAEVVAAAAGGGTRSSLHPQEASFTQVDSNPSSNRSTSTNSSSCTTLQGADGSGLISCQLIDCVVPAPELLSFQGLQQLCLVNTQLPGGLTRLTAAAAAWPKLRKLQLYLGRGLGEGAVARKEAGGVALSGAGSYKGKSPGVYEGSGSGESSSSSSSSSGLASRAAAAVDGGRCPSMYAAKSSSRDGRSKGRSGMVGSAVTDLSHGSHGCSTSSGSSSSRDVQLLPLLATSFPRLQVLEVQQLSCLDDYGLAAALGMPHLRQLYLTSSSYNEIGRGGNAGPVTTGGLTGSSSLRQVVLQLPGHVSGPAAALLLPHQQPQQQQVVLSTGNVVDDGSRASGSSSSIATAAAAAAADGGSAGRGSKGLRVGCAGVQQAGGIHSEEVAHLEAVLQGALPWACVRAVGNQWPGGVASGQPLPARY